MRLETSEMVFPQRRNGRCWKSVVSRKKKRNFEVQKKWGSRCPTPCFLQWIRRIFALKKSQLFGSLLAGSVWEAHVPKTLLFTMNFNDFRGVVFEAPTEPKRSWGLRKIAQGSAVWVQIVRIIHTHSHRWSENLSTTNLQETKVSLSAIYQTEADNDRYEHTS